MRGVLRYAALDRRWLLHEELRLDQGRFAADWPEFDGAILAGVPSDWVDGVLATCRHVIRCSGGADPKETPIASLDDFAVGAMAANHLMNCRLTSFGFLGLNSGGDAGFNVSVKRFAGFSQTLAAQGYICSEPGLGWVATGNLVDDPIWPDLLAWLKRLPKPVGIMAVDDNLAHGLARACLYADLGVPEHVAIIGVNNDDLFCESATVPLSSIEGDYSRVGYAAAAMLDRLLKGEELSASEREVRLPPIRVVQRVSTDIFAVDDPYVADALRFIRENACNRCGVPEVLRHVPVGRRWLERQFIQKLGRSPHDEIIRVRMEEAKRLLQTDLTLKEISDRCGFAALQNFGRTFLKIEGITPGAFRRSVRPRAKS
jgi:LacI family transcriptional regulator